MKVCKKCNTEKAIENIKKGSRLPNERKI